MEKVLSITLLSLLILAGCIPDADSSSSVSLASSSSSISSLSSASSSSSQDPNYNTELTNKATNEIVVLTVNLHTYQEANTSAQMDKVAKTIADLNIDLIAFDECGQNRNAAVISNINGITIKSDNMAKLIVDRLKTDYGLTYYYTWDWAHYGFDQWEEGEAVLSKAPFTKLTSGYISTSTSTTYSTSSASRKAVYAKTTLPGFGDVNFISTHLHWKTSASDTEPINQVNRLKQMIDTNINSSDAFSLVCGDLNSQPTETDPTWSATYLSMTNGYIDTFLVANPHANDMPENSAYDTVKGTYPGRIDYIFLKEGSAFKVRYSEIIFTPTLIGIVSDHYGVVTILQKTN